MRVNTHKISTSPLPSPYKGEGKRRGQTILEYMLMLAVVMVPVALAIREALKDEDKNEGKKNLIRTITHEAYGDEKRMGIIGRPYP